MKADYDFLATDPDVIVIKGDTNIILRFRIVEASSSGAVRTEKFVQVRLSRPPASRLLSVLDLLKKEGFLPEGPPANVIDVPPAKDRN